MNQHFTNRTGQTLFLVFKADEAATGWGLDTVWTIEPGATQTHYALDAWGNVTIALRMKVCLLASIPCGWKAKL